MEVLLYDNASLKRKLITDSSIVVKKEQLSMKNEGIQE